LIGDSMVRVIGDKLCRTDMDFVRICLPGATVKDVDKIISNTNEIKVGDSVTIWAGTNDVLQKNYRHSLSVFERMLNSLKERACTVNVLGLMPGGGCEWWLYNMELERLCNEMNVRFIGWKNEWSKDWMAKDGIHLSRLGNSKVFNRLRLLDY